VPAALEPLRGQVLAIVEQLEEFQRDAAATLGRDDDGVPFHIKKEATSGAAPARPARLRCVFDELAQVIVSEAPLLFQDFERDADGCWKPRFHKV
jgi:hypothetical protein